MSSLLIAVLPSPLLLALKVGNSVAENFWPEIIAHLKKRCESMSSCCQQTLSSRWTSYGER